MPYPDGMTKSDLDHVEGVGLLEPLKTRVLRAVIYLTYEPGPEEERGEDDEGIEGLLPPYEAEKAIERALDPRDMLGSCVRGGLTFVPDRIEVVDAEYMSPAEADA